MMRMRWLGNCWVRKSMVEKLIPSPTGLDRMESSLRLDEDLKVQSLLDGTFGTVKWMRGLKEHFV